MKDLVKTTGSVATPLDEGEMTLTDYYEEYHIGANKEGFLAELRQGGLIDCEMMPTAKAIRCRFLYFKEGLNDKILPCDFAQGGRPLIVGDAEWLVEYLEGLGRAKQFGLL
jgi:hypothetical protein